MERATKVEIFLRINNAKEHKNTIKTWNTHYHGHIIRISKRYHLLEEHFSRKILGKTRPGRKLKVKKSHNLTTFK